jgi:2-oxoglutarate ferredoxin oxidoreductase subunit alpha
MSSKEKRFWSGNIALAEGALAAGVDFYAGYPITPSSEIMEHMARELSKRGAVAFFFKPKTRSLPFSCSLAHLGRTRNP